MKPLNLNQTVYDATQQYPELIPIIANLGFPQIRNEFLRGTTGKMYTLNQAIEQLGLNRTKMLDILTQNGFQII